MPNFQEAVEISLRANTRLDAGVIVEQVRLARSVGNLDDAKRIIVSVLEDYEALNHRRGVVMGQSVLAHILREDGNL